MTAQQGRAASIDTRTTLLTPAERARASRRAEASVRAGRELLPSMAVRVGMMPQTVRASPV